MTQEPDAVADHCWIRRCAIVYKARLTILYHLKRESFFDQVDKWISIATAVAATSAFAGLIGKIDPAGVLAIVTAVLSLVPLVFNPAGAARKHAQLAAEFRQLRAAMERAGEHWTPSQCDEFLARSIELEAPEPAPLSALIAHCQNQINTANDGPITHLTRLQRLLMHLISFDAAKLAAQKQ